ncbi:hypothetical protein Tco_0867328 [Tanacetum coccineum]
MGNVQKSVAERTRHKRQHDRRMNERQMQSRESKVVSSKALDASLVVTQCSGTKSDEHITNSSSGTYITHVVDADIRPVNDQVPSAELLSSTSAIYTKLLVGIPTVAAAGKRHVNSQPHAHTSYSYPMTS